MGVKLLIIPPLEISNYRKLSGAISLASEVSERSSSGSGIFFHTPNCMQNFSKICDMPSIRWLTWHGMTRRSHEIRSSVPTWHIFLTYEYLGRCSERSLQPFAPTVFTVATVMSITIRNFRRSIGRLASGGSLDRIQRKNSRKMIYYKTVNSAILCAVNPTESAWWFCAKNIYLKIWKWNYFMQVFRKMSYLSWMGFFQK